MCDRHHHILVCWSLRRGRGTRAKNKVGKPICPIDKRMIKVATTNKRTSKHRSNRIVCQQMAKACTRRSKRVPLLCCAVLRLLLLVAPWRRCCCYCLLLLVAVGAACYRDSRRKTRTGSCTHSHTCPHTHTHRERIARMPGRSRRKQVLSFFSFSKTFCSSNSGARDTQIPGSYSYRS